MGLVLHQHLHALYICAPELQAVFHALYLGNKFTSALGPRQQLNGIQVEQGYNKRIETLCTKIASMKLPKIEHANPMSMYLKKHSLPLIIVATYYTNLKVLVKCKFRENNVVNFASSLTKQAYKFFPL